MMSFNSLILLIFPSSSSYFALFFLVNSVSSSKLFGVMEALEVILAEELAVLGLTAARHAFAEVNPEIIATTFVPIDSPS